MIDVLFLFLLFPLMAVIAKYLVTLETLMSNTQIITIPVDCPIDPSELLEIVQALLEDLENAIYDAGFICDIDEQDISVSNK